MDNLSVEVSGDWVALEEAAADVLRAIRPTLFSESKRASIILYIQRLLQFSLGCQVYPYGSVPLKTYILDGDVDLTVLSEPNTEDALISDIFQVLQQEELNDHAEFEIKDVQLISAEVKLVKCLVMDIVVDISCNQLGGLCTLIFLEQIDRMVHNNHLFKSSITLIKAWCYYESHILGATHGLFSTYALEVLVLYIFQIHYSSLKGPLSVLHRFLEYFSNFDWENYCLSLHGPVLMSSMPDIVVHTHDVGRHNRLLGKRLVTNLTNLFKVPPKDDGKPSRPFQLKFINIIDPLKDDNNLGRSVNQANSYRIRSALKYGFRKLGQILSLPTESENTKRELKNFFVNTLARHGRTPQTSSPVSDSRSITSFHCSSSDVDSSTGTRSQGAETEGTSDSSSQGSDSSSYLVDRPFQATNLSEARKTAVKLRRSTDIVREPSFGRNKMSEARFDHFADPTGDYESHTKCLLYGQSLLKKGNDNGNGNALQPVVYNAQPLLWNMQCQTNLWQDVYFPMSPTPAIWEQPPPKARGTGTYIPRTDLTPKGRGRHPSRGRKMTQGSSTSQSYNYNYPFSVGMIPGQVNIPYTMQTMAYPSPGYAFSTVPKESEVFKPSSSKNLPGETKPDARASIDTLKPGPNPKVHTIATASIDSLKPEPNPEEHTIARASTDTPKSKPNPEVHTILIPDPKLADTEGALKSVAGKSYQLKCEEDFPPLFSSV